jgi:hypothetical protein
LAHNASAATADTLDSVATELDPAHPHIIGPGCSKSKPTEGGYLFTNKSPHRLTRLLTKRFLIHLLRVAINVFVRMPEMKELDTLS